MKFFLIHIDWNRKPGLEQRNLLQFKDDWYKIEFKKIQETIQENNFEKSAREERVHEAERAFGITKSNHQ